MRAIHVNTSTSWGGLEQYTLYMAEQLQASGVVVQIMAVPDSRLASEARRAGISVISATKGKHINPTNIWRLRRSMDSQTIVHSHTRIDVWTASLACMFTSAPHVKSVHMIPSDKRDPLHAIIYGRIDAIVNTCETHVRNIPKRFPITRNRVHLIRHMRDPREFSFDRVARERYRSEWGIGASEIVVGYVARIDPLKGTREFIEAVDHLTDSDRDKIRLVVVGEPSITAYTEQGSPIVEPAAAELYNAVVQRARDLANRLTVRPFTRDVYALTVLEAMMVGLPVIGTDTDGTPDQLADNRGLLVASRSASAIADGITTLLRDPLRRSTISERGKVWATKEFNLDTVLPRWIELYRTLLKQRSKR
ncbi:MAG: glycosyltransferase family 4 protein [Candidatus Kapabacteria bacterium]|nr:glycosyltransferase family 4 protein [Candidatus Kapabacteria bacterium]